MSDEETIKLRYRLNAPLLIDALKVGTQWGVLRGGQTSRGLRIILESGIFAVAVVLAVLGVELLLDRDFQAVEFASGALLSLIFVKASVTRSYRRLARRILDSPINRDDSELVLDAQGISFQSKHSYGLIRWRAVDAILDLSGGLGLRVGGSTVAILDAALPTGLTRAGLRERIIGWQRISQ